MEVKNCRECGCLYNYIGGSYRNLCPNCITRMEEKFQVVKEYIESHVNATMPMISKECDIRVDQLERWVREERLFFSENSPIGISCEGCGAMIKSGRFCPECKARVTNTLSSAYGSPIPLPTPKKERTSARMRFLEGHNNSNNK